MAPPEEQLIELIRHNKNLVTTATTLQQQVTAGVRAVTNLINGSDPIQATDGTGNTYQYKVTAEDLEELRSWSLLCKATGYTDQ